MRSYKTKRAIASVVLAAQLFTSTPMFANENVNVNSNKKVIVEKSEVNELQESLERKDYVTFQKKYDELIKRGLIKGEIIGKYAPVLGPKTQKAINNLKSNGYLLDEQKAPEVTYSTIPPIENETEESSINGFKDEMKKTPYDKWDEQKQLEKALTKFEEKIEYLKLLENGNIEYPYTYYIGDRWLSEYSNTIKQLEAQYSNVIKYENSKDKMDEITQKHLSKNYTELLGSSTITYTNAKYVLNELKIMRDKIKTANPVQLKDIISETKKQINGRIEGPVERILIVDSNKMPYLYSYSIENNLKPNYLDILENISSNKEFINHKKWLNESYFISSKFGDYNKDEVITAYNELSLGTQHALYKHYFEKHGEKNIVNGELFATQIFGLNVQGYESGASIVQYLDKMNTFNYKTQLEIYRRIGASTTYYENESDWTNFKLYVYTDVNDAFSKVLKTDIVMIREQTKDRFELKSASIGSPGTTVKENLSRKGSGGVSIQESFTMVEQGFNDFNNNINIQGSNVRVTGAPHLSGTNLENSRPKGHARNVDDIFGRNRVETNVPNTNVQIIKTVMDLGVFNTTRYQKGTFSNLLSKAQEDFHYTKTTDENLTLNGINTSDVTTNYTSNLDGNLYIEGPYTYSRNDLTWLRSNSSSSHIISSETNKETIESSSTTDSFNLNSKNRNLFNTNNFGLSVFDLEANFKNGNAPNTYNLEKSEILIEGSEIDESYTLSKTNSLMGGYEYYLHSKLFSGYLEGYSRLNMGDTGSYLETKTFKDPITGENEITKTSEDYNSFKEWDFEKIIQIKDWALHAGTQQLNVYTNSMYFTGLYNGVFTLRPENSYYVKFGEVYTSVLNEQTNSLEYNWEKIHSFYKGGEDVPTHIIMDRNVFNSNIDYHGVGGVLGIPFGNENELGFGYVHNNTLMDKNKHLGILSYSWNEQSVVAVSVYNGDLNLSRNNLNLFNSSNQVTRNDIYSQKFPRDVKSIEDLYKVNGEATFGELTIINKDNLNISAFAGSGEEYKRIQAGAISNYVHDLFKLKVGGDYDEGNNLEKENGSSELYLANKKETAYLLASFIAQKELGWKQDDALRYLGEPFGLKVEFKAYGSFSKNENVNETGRFIGSEISFKDDLVVLYYFGGKDVYSEQLTEHKEFNLAGAQVKFTPNFSIEGYGTWTGDLGNGGFIHPIFTHNNKFGASLIVGYTQDKVNFNLLNEKIKKDYLTTGLALGFRKGGLSLLLLPMSYTNNFDYKHIIETGLSGTYWLPGGSLGFGTGYVHNLIQNPIKSEFENPFKLPYKNNNFNSRMFYLYGEGSGRGFGGFDYTSFRLTGKFGENELYKLYQTIATLEMSDFWKRVYLDLSFSYRMDKGDLIFQENQTELNNLKEKYDVRGILGIDFYF